MRKAARHYRSAVVTAMVLVALSLIPIFMSEPVLDAFVREDHIYEWLTFFFLLTASVLFAVAFLRSWVKFNLRDPFWIRKMVFLGLALLLFGAAGEEISWGQRLLGFETPNLVESHNFQKEFTLHNLDFIQGPDAIVPLDFDQISAIFFLSMGAFIPLICYFVPRKARGPSGSSPCCRSSSAGCSLRIMRSKRGSSAYCRAFHSSITTQP